MTNRHGTPIWYELTSADPDASKAFYDRVIGWTIEPTHSGEMDYRMIDSGQGLVGGLMRLTPEMAAGGAKPGWLFYIGVDDVDATAEAITAAGGAVHMGPWNIPDVGRAAVVADPQGLPFYIMRGDSDENSTAFDRTGLGKCNWNELITPDQAVANAFYARLFGWSYPDKMAMPGDMGDYIFIAVGGETIGATMQHPGEGPPAGWRFYFRAPDIEAAAARVGEAGGSVMMGPMEVPGGDRIIVASDPHGVVFGVVGPGAGA
uniref:VOC family protein n=1 Tax=uncultured Sphingomonas sp. TaxID=158754 RepID=UPI0035CA0C34